MDATMQRMSLEHSLLPITLLFQVCGLLLFCICPEPAQWEHAKVVNDRVHDVESEVLATLLDISQIEFLTPDSC